MPHILVNYYAIPEEAGYNFTKYASILPAEGWIFEFSSSDGLSLDFGWILNMWPPPSVDPRSIQPWLRLKKKKIQKGQTFVILLYFFASPVPFKPPTSLKTWEFLRGMVPMCLKKQQLLGVGLSSHIKMVRKPQNFFTQTLMTGHLSVDAITPWTQWLHWLPWQRTHRKHVWCLGLHAHLPGPSCTVISTNSLQK